MLRDRIKVKIPKKEGRDVIEKVKNVIYKMEEFMSMRESEFRPFPPINHSTERHSGVNGMGAHLRENSPCLFIPGNRSFIGVILTIFGIYRNSAGNLGG
jgi:hypothetical protein